MKTKEPALLWQETDGSLTQNGDEAAARRKGSVNTKLWSSYSLAAKWYLNLKKKAYYVNSRSHARLGLVYSVPVSGVLGILWKRNAQLDLEGVILSW